MFKRPKNEKELQKQEAIGVIRASRFIRKQAGLDGTITVDTIYQIHKEIFINAWPEIAGNFRNENLKITGSKHLPPHHSKVLGFMKEVDKIFRDSVEKLKKIDGAFLLGVSDFTEEIGQQIDDVVGVAAWIHHKITYIHPFRDGNGRTARLSGNLVLERYGLVGISIKIERENKNRYRQALSQIDRVDDYAPLKSIIYDGLFDRYNGVTIKYYSN